MTPPTPKPARPAAPAGDPLADLKAPPRPGPKPRSRKITPAPGPVPAEVALPPLDGIDPAKASDLLRYITPYNPPPRPYPRPGHVTFWDPGLSIDTLRVKFRAQFFNADWAVKLPFGKAAVVEGWRQLRLIPPGQGYDRQTDAIANDEETAPARVVVTYLALAFLSAGAWPDLPRVRCRDTLPSGRRVVVGCFPGHGIDLANVGDDWTTPGLAVVAVPPVTLPPSRRR